MMLSKTTLMSLPITMGLILVSNPAQTQMRTGVPEVLRPPPQAVQHKNPGPTIEMFRKANIQQGRPRILVFWNRQLSDEVTSRYESSLSFDARQNAQASATGFASSTTSGDSFNVEQQGSASASLEITERDRRVDAAKHRHVAELVSWEIENTFESALINAGARLIDRNMIIRTAGKDAGSNEQINVMALETSAMIGKADLLMEVLISDSPIAATDINFRITVKDINTGEIVTVVSTPLDLQSQTDSYYAATERGFVHEQQSFEPTLSEAGNKLAVAAMSALTSTWVNRGYPTSG